MEQTSNTILMIRPINFRMNEQTIVNNYYQKVLDNVLPKTVNKKAQQEFDIFVEKLQKIGVNVIVVSDTNKNDTPDSIFPNNWISFHQNGTVGLYSMFAKNRRLERRKDILQQLELQGFIINKTIDYTKAEGDNVFLEGTGSFVLDRVNRKAYCNLSQRADENLFLKFCEDFQYTPIMFVASQSINDKRMAIYHTNVMMCIGETFAVICLKSIESKIEKINVIEHLKSSNKEIIDITERQLISFAGNMLQIKGKDDASYIVMSQSAYNSLNKKQVIKLEKHGKILFSSLNTIEACGGGSARCMMVEVFLPKQK